MARDLTAIAAEIAKPLATEPQILIEITWGFTGPTETYTDLDKIVSFSPMDTVIRIGSGGQSGSVSLTLDDTDGSIRTIFESNDVQKGACKVYQTYKGFVTKSLLLSGEINTPVIWNEGERTVTLTIASRVESKEVGFSVEAGEFDFIADSAIGKAWPLCFGSPLLVPSVKLIEEPRGTSLTRYSSIPAGSLESLCDSAKAQGEAEYQKSLADLDPGFTDANYAVIVNNLGSAISSVNSIINGIEARSPGYTGSLNSIVEDCKNTRLAEIDADTYDAESAALLTTQSTLEAQEESIQQSLIDETNKAKPDALVIFQLRAQLQAVEISLLETNASLSASQLQLVTALTNITIWTDSANATIAGLVNINLPTILVQDGDKFPQGVNTRIIINGMMFSGTFSGQTFTVTQGELPAIPNNTADNGPLGIITTGNSFQINDASLNLRGQYCFYSGRGIVHIDDQIGLTCYYSPTLFNKTGELEPIPGTTNVREIYSELRLTGGYSEASPIIKSAWLNSLSAGNIPTYASGLSNSRSSGWDLEVGDEIYIVGDYQEKYVANLIPSTEVHEVFARRNVDGDTKLVPVPSRYYTVNLSEAIAGQTSTTIAFNLPLKRFIGEGWDDQIYVSLTSTVGPNTSDIIKYLVETYTNFTADVTSFASVQTLLTAYPSHFAVLDRPDALALIEDIAWEARCAVFIANESAKITYLSKTTTPVRTFTESDVALQSMIVELTPTEDLVTKLTALWRVDYSGEEEEDLKFIIRNNITKYGSIDVDYQTNIYNIRSLVEKSLTFWMMRLSNTYKILKFTGFMTSLEIEPYDVVTLNFAGNFIANGSVAGVVLSADYDSASNTVDYIIQTSVRAGEMDQYEFYFPGDSVETYPGPTDIYAGSGV